MLCRHPPTRRDQALGRARPTGHPGLVALPRQDPARLGRLIRARRIDLGHDSYEAFAKAARISIRTIGSIERGDSIPSSRTATKLEKALGWESGSVDAVLRGGHPVLAGLEHRTQSGVLDRIRASTPEDLLAARHMYAEFHGAEAADAWLIWAMRERERGPERSPGDSRPATA